MPEPTPDITMVRQTVHPHPLAPWAPLAAAVIWGAAYVAVAFALRGFGPLAIAFWRAVIGCLSLGTWLVWKQGIPVRLPWAVWWRLFVLAMTGAAFFWSAMNVAVKLSAAVNVSFLASSYPVIVAALGPLLLGERLRRRTWWALAISAVGVYLVISKGHPLDLFSSDTIKGDLVALAGSVSFAAYILLGRLWAPRLRLPSAAVTFFTFALSLPVLAVVALSQGPLVTHATVASVVALLWLGILASTGAFLALNWGFSHGSVSRSSIHLLAIAPVTALCAWLLLGVSMTGVQWLGGALVLLGILAAQ